MNCHECQPLLGPWMDGELDREARLQLDAHVASCADCRAEAEALASQHEALRTVFASRAESAARVIAGVAAALATGPIVRSSDLSVDRPARRGVRLATHLLSAVAGFLVAVLLLPAILEVPTKPRTNVTNGVSDSPPLVSPATTVPAAMPSAATLVLATGPVEYRLPASVEWKPAVAGFTCPSSASVRTTENALCELKTADECLVRLDQQTELAFDAACELTLRQGKVWCQAPAGRRLVVRGATATEREPVVPLVCTTGAATWTMTRADANMVCCSTDGDVRIEIGQAALQLAPGKAVEIDGVHCTNPATMDRLQASRWMWPLLIRQGPENAELHGQVNALLSQLGRSKVSYLHESEIRSLGAYAALPLLRFVQAANPADDGTQRVLAMRILADVAPVSFVPDLIDLLGHADPEIRVSAAAALQRLTGVSQGRAATEWRNPGTDNDRELAAWRAWWQQEGARFPSLWQTSPEIR